LRSADIANVDGFRRIGFISMRIPLGADVGCWWQNRRRFATIRIRCCGIDRLRKFFWRDSTMPR
jgi:hypothetical protein